MKALSLHQPYASWVADGSKTIETRGWATSWRGLVLVCSTAVTGPGPRGMALCVVRVADCRPMTLDDVPAARCPLYPAAVAWLLEDLRALETPVPIRGRQRLWTPATESRLVKELAGIGLGLRD